MNLEEIKQAVESGHRVFWKTYGYEVINDSVGQWLIYCHLNHSCIGLTWRDGKTMNGEESVFFIHDNYSRATFCQSGNNSC